MLEGGGDALVFTGSFVGNSVGPPGMAAYAAAKAGLMGLMRSLTADYGALGVRADALNGCRAKNARGRGGRKANGSCPRDVDG